MVLLVVQHLTLHCIVRTQSAIPKDDDYMENFQPDYYAEYEGFIVMLGEVKLPTPDQNVKDEDRGKLFSMMKIMLNRLLRNGVDDPTMLGFLVQGKWMKLLSELYAYVWSNS